MENFRIKSLTIHPDPRTGREKFKNWVTDLQNVFYTHHLTSGIMDKYPAEVKKIKDMAVDKAIKTVLFAVTFGETKELISQASQTSVTDKHSEHQKLFKMKQKFRKPASEFMSRARTQLAIAMSMGCNDFDDEEIVADIVLQGLSENTKLSTATLAEQKATLVRNPSAISLTSLEETFFGKDNSAAIRFIKSSLLYKN